MIKIDPILADKYRLACIFTIRKFLEAKAAGFPDDLLVELADATREEDAALAHLENGWEKPSDKYRKVFSVSARGEKGRAIREEVMRSFGMEIPPRIISVPTKQKEGSIEPSLF